MPGNHVICGAIDSMKVIEFDYTDEQGHVIFVRIVEPYAHGINTQQNDALRGYQIGGASWSGTEPPWRMFLISRMRNLRMLEQGFESTADGYKLNDSAFSPIFCQVPLP